MQDLQQYLVANVDTVRFYQTEIDGFEPNQNVVCPFHEDNDASLSINTDGAGEYYCHSGACGAHGTSIIGFYMQLHGAPYQLALHEIYAKYIRPVIPTEKVLEWHSHLLEIPAVQEWLLENRGITVDSIKYFKMGFDGSRVTIPVENQFGMVVNIRRYDISKRQDAKMISYDKGYGGAMLFPSFNFNREEVVLVEGELDCILGNQLGIPCICNTGGANTWSPEFTNLLAGKKVTILYDADEAGRQGAAKVINQLSTRAHVIRLAEYPADDIDLTDFVVHMDRKPEELIGLIKSAKVVEINNPSKFEVLYERVRLQSATDPKYRGKPVEFKASVIGKDTQPYYVPKRIRTRCMSRPEKRCRACSGPEPYTSIVDIQLKDEAVLGFINKTENRLHSNLKSYAHCNGNCNVDIEILETTCCEEIKLVAPLDEVSSEEDFKYVVRIGYIVGTELQANATYIFRGYPYPDPETQHVVFLLVEAEPAADRLDHYQLTEGDVQLLRETFPGGKNIEEIHTFLDDLYTYLAISTTKIYERRALHQAVDMVFHSAMAFYFNGEFIRRGWLDVLVMGDTRTGKGYVTERLCRYYNAGEVASGENCTFSGLVGGVQQIGSRKSWIVTWGFLPRNDRRLGIIDEAGSVASDTLSRMSRVRSEGIAEVFKIVTERTMARTRVIWNANPTDGRSVREFEHGIESVVTMTDKKEDIARFDYAIIVSSDDVDPEIINAVRIDMIDARPRFQESCQKLIQWIWSRRATDIIFEEDAIRSILTHSKRLGQAYHPSIPLIQIENVRIKLAKIATAVAGRVFSCDKDGSKLVVTEACAEYAAGFLDYIYSSETCAYDVYSGLKREQNTLSSVDELIRLFAIYKGRGRAWVNDLLDSPKLSVKSIEASLGLDFGSAKEIRNRLVSLRAIKQEHSYWVKREPFIRLLRQLRTRYIKNPEWWKEYE